MKPFELRGLEIHTSRMWQLQAVERAIDFMSRTGLNALIFHRNDLIDALVFPTRYFSSDLMWRRWPVRMHTIQNNRQYINRVVREAKAAGIAFYAQVKELWYPEELLELVPELRNRDGSLCPNDPFWWEFLGSKMDELLSVVPDLAGVIVSPGTRESRVSISTNKCRCDRCARSDAREWYTQLLNTMYRPLAEKGKTLVVRDFAYTAEQQSLILDAANACSDRIVIALKNTPHDFYPTFPTNPRIGHSGEHPQWVEFDTWGQFFGLGLFPVSVVEDMQDRIRYCHAQGVSGVWFRTDWEAMTEASSFNSLNMVNLFGGALLAGDGDTALDTIFRAWSEYGLSSALQSGTYFQVPVSPIPSATERLKRFMRASWQVMEKTVYVRGHLFHEDGMFPDSVRTAVAMMVEIHGRDDWEPGASRRVELTQENLKVIFAEKEQAVQEVQALPGILRADTLGLPSAFVQELEEMLDLYGYYVKGFKACAAVIFLARLAQSTCKRADVQAAARALEQLHSVRQEIVERLRGTRYPHYVYWMLDEQRLDLLGQDVESMLRAIDVQDREP